MRIDLVTLKIFLTVIEERNFARAAERHFIATSAVSKRISDLEDVLGVQLLERRNMGVRPTPAGLELVTHAKDMMLVMARMRAQMSEFGDGSKGEVRVFANSTAIVGFLGPTIRTFLEAYPQIDVHLEEWSSPFIVRALRDGIADLGVFWSGVSTAGLVVHPFRRSNLVAVVPLQHALADRSEVSFAETLDYDLIAFHEGSLIFRMMQSYAADLQRKLRIRLQVTSFDAMRTMVRSGIGLAVMSDVTVGPPDESFGYKVVPITDEWAKLESLIGYRDFNALPRSAQNFVRHLQRPYPHRAPEAGGAMEPGRYPLT
ncbi:LysR family transcriptional regulator [Caballeronia catudaia]|uniref:LysR family transcriptional regulator n=1 Tax=Caballeronia catudaia TaxID=1777136 RepID=A0A158C6M5_9BURK|nr:LysR family transcriptional regulator [Caballeronia catudaia]SAK77940.1 LysR family transcriptional regulator [Caballeronia catudaia]